MRYRKSTEIDAPAEVVFSFHEEEGAFERLLPPWQKVRVVRGPESLEVGTRVVLEVKVGPFWQTIEAEHVEYEPGRKFTDRMVRGPFRSWIHQHVVEAVDEARCKLVDDIEYELPFGVFGRVVGGAFASRSLDRLFRYRHRVTRESCERPT